MTLLVESTDVGLHEVVSENTDIGLHDLVSRKY